MVAEGETKDQQIERLEAAALASDAATLLADARIGELIAEVEGLRKAMEHRAVIEQAKGVLMSTMHIGADAAFAVLIAASQRENVKLRDIAERISGTQDLRQDA